MTPASGKFASLLALFCLLVVRTIHSKQNEAALQIAFGIMVYQKSGRTAEQTYADFLRTMAFIYEGDQNHIYVIHIDVKSEAALVRAITEGFCAPKKNCKWIPSRNVAWAGLTTGEMMLALMQKANEFYWDDVSVANVASNWEYFVFVTHESIPLTPLGYMENFLASYPSGTNFINCWPVDGYDFFGQWEVNTWRLEVCSLFPISSSSI